MEVLRAMAKSGMKQSVSDAGVGALCARSAVLGAGLNVRINVGGLKDEGVAQSYQARADELTAAGDRRRSGDPQDRRVAHVGGCR